MNAQMKELIMKQRKKSDLKKDKR